MARKPRPIVRRGREWARCWMGWKPLVSLRSIGPTTLLTLPEARRLRAWLDRAIAWMEEREAEDGGR